LTRTSIPRRAERATTVDRQVGDVASRKDPGQIALMRKAGRVVAEMHEECIRAAVAGATTLDVDAAARAVLERRGARSNFLGYHGFPAVVCASPNDVIVHGIPSASVVLQEGDILSIDCGAIIEGWHADAAITVPVGEVDAESQRLMDVTRAALESAIFATVEGNRLGDIGAAAEREVTAARFGVVREYVGHGIGTAMHEEPDVPNYGPPGRGMKLKAGHVLAIEPMVTAGKSASLTLDDGWTVVTADGSRAAHFEHTVAITEHGPEILTLP
jgi:methionyl aminopeptidase